MATIDVVLVVLYFVVLLWLGLRRRLSPDSGGADLILGGRVLTLPAFVASLVSTWYGGILGVGEFGYQYGVSVWLTQGLPFYLAALLFALFLAKRARRTEVLTIPQRLRQTYGDRTALAGGMVIFLMMIPGAYVLMLGTMARLFLGWPMWLGVIIGTAISLIYVFEGGFRAVVRTDLMQFGLMFAGFAVLLGFLIAGYGGYDFIATRIPAEHFSWHGGNSGLYIISWYFIALITIIEPTFHQRCYAARNEGIARTGILVSIACWAVFDFMTTSCALYARALLPQLADPIAAFPALAELVLPPGLFGLFAVALLATVMSTVDSYSFVAASTWGHDIVPHFGGGRSDGAVGRQTRLGLVLSGVLAVALALFFDSVIEIWYVFGTIGTSALLLPVAAAFMGWRRLSPGASFWTVTVAGAVAVVWYASCYATPSGAFWFGIDPVFPGLVVSLVMMMVSARSPKQGCRTDG